tara:strand:+ start:105 stop:536 length:432 start_codon:yes stop_codon:yes gene_type:complete
MNNKIEWDGEGKPPIGCECEYKRRYSGTIWDRIKIFGVGDTFYLVKFGNGNEGTLLIDEFTIRPLRSEEDIEREKVLDQMEKDGRSWGCGTVCKNLYEAGYHNEPKQGKVVNYEVVCHEWGQTDGFKTISGYITNRFTITRKE